MSLRFILGRAGAGKTRLCLDEIRQRLRQVPDGPPLVFLVPEQATFQTEHTLALTPDLPGIMRAHVLSFRRLAWRVFSEVGGAARPHIGELGKQMLLSRILDERRRELSVFGRAARQFGFAGTVARALSELKTYLVTPEDLERAGGLLAGRSGSGSLAGKVRDLRLVYEEFEARLAGRYVDPDDYLTLLAAQLEESRTLAGAEVWVDGFAGFTPQEFRVLQGLLRTAGRVSVALCVDPARDREAEAGLFHVTGETHARLAELARQDEIALERPVRLGARQRPRFKNSPGIAHLEREFFRRPAAVYSGDTGLTLAAAANRRAEVEGAAREIRRLCRERGYRWREVSVVVRDLETYHELLATGFADYGIPCFIDRKRLVLHHPLVEFIRAALEVVCTDWAYDPVFRWLKTDLAAVSREEVDLLENYVLAHGIRGAKWTEDQDWPYLSAATLEAGVPGEAERRWLVRVNDIRRRAVRPLREFQDRVAAPGNVRELTASLYDLITGSGVPERIARWSREAEQEGLLDIAREHRQIWDGVVQLFDQLEETLGDERLSLDEYARILEAGAAGLRLSLIPPALDQVLVGSLDRSRNPDVRATFVLGVSDGVLPARQVEGGLFTDREREALLATGLEVAPDARCRLYTEQYLVYIALTRASEYLWVSYPLADEEGRALAPSGVIGRLKELFPDLREKTLPVEPQGTVAGADVPFVSVPDRTLGFLGTRLRAWRNGNPIDPIWWSVYNWFCGREAYKDGLRLVLQALFHENRNEPLDPERRRLLYGSPLAVSVTRLERFRGCPFAHFAHYGLRLRERAVCRLEAPDLGQFFHAALKGVEDRLAEQSLDWGALDAAECKRLAGQVVDGLAPRLRSEILLSSPRYRFLTGKLGRVVEHTTRALAAQARQSRFRPVGWEIPFGRGHDVPPLVYELPGGGVLELAGRIDRVDAARTPARNFVRVVDYKAGGAVLRLDDVFYGLDIQLLVYLEACLRHAGKIVGGPCLPGGAFYFRVGSPMLRKRAPLSAAEIEPQLMKLYRMQGLVLEDAELVRLMDGAAAGESLIIPAGFNKDGGLRRKPNVLKLEHFERLREHLGRVITDTGAAIEAGEVAAAPYRKGRMTACRYCPYKPVCGFDPLIASDRYRELRPVSGPEVWRLLGVPEEGRT